MYGSFSGDLDNYIVLRYYRSAIQVMSTTHREVHFQAMAEIRYQIRRFLRFSETVARQAGIEPQQHQLLLAVKGLPDGVSPTIGVLAERMQLQHHSTGGLVDRLVERGFLVRLRATNDKRQVLVKLTHDGENFLQKLALPHLHEIQSIGPRCVTVMQSLIEKHDRFSRWQTRIGSDFSNKPISVIPRRDTKNG